MSAKRALTELQERKRLLALQADLHRAILRAESTNLAGRLHWITRAGEKMRLAAPWLAGGAALAAWIAARNRTTAARWISAAFAAWRWIRKTRPE